MSVRDPGTVDEGESLAYTVPLSPATTSAVTVDWGTTSGGTAFAGVVYRSSSRTVPFAAGQTVRFRTR